MKGRACGFPELRAAFRDAGRTDIALQTNRGIHSWQAPTNYNSVETPRGLESADFDGVFFRPTIAVGNAKCK